METLRQSYSMSDLRAEGEEEDMADLGQPRGRRLRYKQSDYEAEMRRSRRLQTGSMLALTSESHQERDLGGRREEAEVPRRRATSVRQKRPVGGSNSSITPRPSSMYGTLPRSVSRLSSIIYNHLTSLLSLEGGCRSLRPRRRLPWRAGG